MSGASFTLPIDKPNTAPPKPGFVEMYISSDGVLMVRNSDDVHAPLESARELIGKPNGLVSTNENGNEVDLIYCHRTGVPKQFAGVNGEIQISKNSSGDVTDLIIHSSPNDLLPPIPIMMASLYSRSVTISTPEAMSEDILLFDPWSTPSGYMATHIVVGSGHASGNTNLHGLPDVPSLRLDENGCRHPFVCFFYCSQGNFTIKHLSSLVSANRNKIRTNTEEDIVLSQHDMAIGMTTIPSLGNTVKWIFKKL